MCFHNFIHNKAHVGVKRTLTSYCFPLLSKMQMTPLKLAACIIKFYQMTSIYGLTPTACIGCLTNWVSMMELNCTVEGFGPQPWQGNI